MLDKTSSAFGYEPTRPPLLQEVARIRRASWAFTTRRVPGGAACMLLDEGTPKAGDLVQARVDALGQHRHLQLATGRRASLFLGDEIVVAYGNRYASSQFEAIVPQTLGPCHLVAGGGVAAKARSWHERMGRGPTQITPLGLLGDTDGRPLNLRDFGLEPIDTRRLHLPPTIAVVGTAMDSGKTQTAAHLVRGLVRAGARVGFAKVTGTGAGGDFWLLHDAGADPVLDFTDAGYISTYLVPLDEIEAIVLTLTAHLARSGVDAIVLEVADGVLQEETAALLTSRTFRQIVGGLLFAACDSMGAVAGTRWMRDRGLPLVALSGVLTASPLQRQEAEATTGETIYARNELAEARFATKILGHARTSDGRGGIA